MTCRLTVTLLSEYQEGECGDDWKYDLDVKVFNQGLKGRAVISVPEHKLATGAVAKPHGSPEPMAVYDGECVSELLVRTKLTVTEVDLSVNDVGKASMDFRLECPGPDGGSLARDVEISAGVCEAPGLVARGSVFTVKARFDLVCE